MKKLKCLLGLHDYELHPLNFGECSPVLAEVLARASLTVKTEYKEGCFHEYWLKCSRCGKEIPDKFK